MMVMRIERERDLVRVVAVEIVVIIYLFDSGTEFIKSGNS